MLATNRPPAIEIETEDRSPLDEYDNACYYRPPAIEIETEDKEDEEQGNRRSCHYKAKRSYY